MSTRDGTTPPSEVQVTGMHHPVSNPPESEYPGAAGQRRFPVAPSVFPAKKRRVDLLAPGECLPAGDSCYHVGLSAAPLLGVLP